QYLRAARQCLMECGIKAGNLEQTGIVFGKCADESDFGGKMFGGVGLDALELREVLQGDLFGRGEFGSTMNDAVSNRLQLVQVRVRREPFEQRLDTCSVIRRIDGVFFLRVGESIGDFQFGVGQADTRKLPSIETRQFGIAAKQRKFDRRGAAVNGQYVRHEKLQPSVSCARHASTLNRFTIVQGRVCYNHLDARGNGRSVRVKTQRYDGCPRAAAGESVDSTRA